MPDKPKETNGQQPDSSFIQLDDPKQKGAASAASAPRRKALLGVLTAACVVLIVVSLGFVHPSESGAWSIDWIVQTGQKAHRTLPNSEKPTDCCQSFYFLLLFRRTSCYPSSCPIPCPKTRNLSWSQICQNPYEKDENYGSGSGWCYSVNGTTPMTACSNYVLSNGDNVVWYYVTG